MGAKSTFYLIGGLAAIYLLTMKSNKAFAGITSNSLLRGCDPLGCGNFGARRSGGARTHKGIDFVTVPGQDILSPISGTVTRFPVPYADDPFYKGIEIKNADYTVKMFYLAPAVAQNAKVAAGQKIGVAQNISAKHGQSMTNHVHIEAYDKSGKLIDITTLLPAANLNRDLVLKKGVANSAEVEVLQGWLGIAQDGDFGQQTENALFAKRGKREITLKSFWP